MAVDTASMHCASGSNGSRSLPLCGVHMLSQV